MTTTVKVDRSGPSGNRICYPSVKYAHDRDIALLDLKPANINVTVDGPVKCSCTLSRPVTMGIGMNGLLYAAK